MRLVEPLWVKLVSRLLRVEPLWVKLVTVTADRTTAVCGGARGFHRRQTDPMYRTAGHFGSWRPDRAHEFVATF